MPIGYRLTSVALLVIAGGFAPASFWPRGYPVLQLGPLRDYVTEDDAVTRLTLLDTFALMDHETARMLQHKARRLYVALAGIGVAAVVLMLGISMQASEKGSPMSDQQRRPSSEMPKRPRPQPPPPRPDPNLIGYIERSKTPARSKRTVSKRSKPD